MKENGEWSVGHVNTTDRYFAPLRGPRWRALGTTVFVIPLLCLALRPAAALQPVSAHLSILGGATDGTAYVAVRLPNGEITGYDSGNVHTDLGLPLNLEITFEDGSTVDVTQDPNTEFASLPALPSRFTGNQGTFQLFETDAGSQFELIGTYTSPDAPETPVSDMLTVRIELFDAPSFFDAGRGQARYLQDVKQLSHQIEAWLRARQVSSESAAPILTSLERLRIYLNIWWTWKLVSPIVSLGNSLQALGAPPHLLRQLSRFVVDLDEANLLGLAILGGGEATIEPRTPIIPPWLPSAPIVGAFSPPLIVFWFGLT